MSSEYTLSLYMVRCVHTLNWNFPFLSENEMGFKPLLQIYRLEIHATVSLDHDNINTFCLLVSDGGMF